LNDTIVKNILVDLKKRPEAVSAEEAQYTSVALATLQEFTDICKNMTSFNEDVELVLVFNNAPPVGLQEGEEEAYAEYVHKLFCEGSCYGMAEQDPLSTLVLLGGVFRIVRTISEADPDNYKLVSIGLDLLLFQAIALRNMKEAALAKRNLLTILEVASDMENLQAKYTVRDPRDMLVDVASRAAPSAWLLSCILHEDDDDKAAHEYLVLASSMYAQIVNSRAVKHSSNVAALIGFAETLAMQDKMVSCVRVLDKAIKNSKKLLKKEVTPYNAFLASVAYHRRGELYAIIDEWNMAFENFTEAIKWIVKATEIAPINTHYEERYTQYLNELGILHGVRGDLVNAQKVFLKAINHNRALIVHSEKYKSSLVSTLNNMSILMHRYGRHHVAKYYLQESIEVIDGMADAYTEMNREEMRDSLTETMKSLDALMRERKSAAWRPVWNPEQSSYSPSLPN